MTGRGEEGLDLAKLSKNFLPRWDFIIDYDNENGRDEALKALESELQG